MQNLSNFLDFWGKLTGVLLGVVFIGWVSIEVVSAMIEIKSDVQYMKEEVKAIDAKIDQFNSVKKLLDQINKKYE
jgi:hypothetical protein